MLKSLRIQNIVLVDDIEIDFADGFCVITGETGAGKSIILNCLHLIKGSTSSTKLIRKGQSTATVTAVFTIRTQDFISILDELSIEKSNELIIRRVLDSSGKSKVYINDVRVSFAALKTVTNGLFEMHGQREQYSILDVSKHRELVDSYAKHDKLLEILLELYTDINTINKKLQHISDLKAIREKEKSFLEFVVNELKTLDIQDKEESELIDQRTHLKSIKKRNTVINSIIEELDHSNIEKILFDIQKIVISNDDIFSQYKPQQTSITSSIEKAVDEVVKIKDSFLIIRAHNPDVRDLQSIEERLFSLKDASNKYNTPIDQLSQYLKECELKLNSLDECKANIEAYNKKISVLKESYYQTSKTLSDSRKKNALMIEKKIMKELDCLKLDKAVFKINIETDSLGTITPHGQDQVSFMASTNPGSPLSLLSKIASGGEMSRFMLATKLVLANQKDCSTLVFDEIDTGIGGATADAVGDRLQSLSSINQLIVVTHHPQVASKAHMHILVNKLNKTNSTAVAIQVLGVEEKRQEIARMLSGSSITKEALAAADTLLVNESTIQKIT